MRQFFPYHLRCSLFTVTIHIHPGGATWKSKIFVPATARFLHTVNANDAIVGTVVCLLLISCPSTVVRTVTFGVIYTVYFKSFLETCRYTPLNELSFVVEPFITHLDAFGSPTSIVLVFGIITPLLYTVPPVSQKFLCFSVVLSNCFMMVASTRYSFSLVKLINRYITVFSTVTFTMPYHRVSRSPISRL